MPRRSITSLIAMAWAWRGGVVAWAVVWAVGGAWAECPKVCECKWRDGKEMVVCRNANFIDIPRGLEPTTQVLDLRHNNLRILPRDSFAYSGLRNLQKAWLSFCNIRWVEAGAFRKMTNVKELDLSNNHLVVVPGLALRDLASLRELRMSHNALTAVPAAAFVHAPHLVHLDLSYNRIEAVEVGALSVLGNLEVLNIANNNLSFLNATGMKSFQVLRVIKLHSNPWTCDCRLRQLRHWMAAQRVSASVPPSCGAPEWLAGHEWGTLGEGELVCGPETWVVAPRVLATDRDNVTLMCRVTSEVEVWVSWLVNNEPIHATNASHRYVVREADSGANHVSNLTIVAVNVEDQGTYQCVAENRAGISTSDVMLQVSHEVAEVRVEAVERGVIGPGVVGGVGALLLVAALTCTAFYCRVRQHPRPPTHGSPPNPTHDAPDPPHDHHISLKQSWVISDAGAVGGVVGGSVGVHVHAEPDLDPVHAAQVVGAITQRPENVSTKVSVGPDAAQTPALNTAVPPPLSQPLTYAALQARSSHFPDLLDFPYLATSPATGTPHLGTAQLAIPTQVSKVQGGNVVVQPQPGSSTTPDHAPPPGTAQDLCTPRQPASHTTSPLRDGSDTAVVCDSGGFDASRFEYHTMQLEKFLSEYQRLHDQLLHMRHSYETRHHRSTPRLDDWQNEDEGRGATVSPGLDAVGHGRLAETSFTVDPSPPRTSEPLKSILKKSSEGGTLPRRNRTASLHIVDPREWQRAGQS